MNFDLKLKPYIFNPEIFFSKLCLFVEGPGDEYAIRALDESKNNVLEENDILLVNVGGKENIEPYISLIENYELPHIIMVDKDYAKKQTADTIKLSDDFRTGNEKNWLARTKQ